MALGSVHSTHLELPGGSIRPLLASDLYALGPRDVVIWGSAPSGWSVSSLSGTGVTVLSPDPRAVSEVRRAGLRAFLLPDLSPETLARAVEPSTLLAVEAGTLVPERAELWTEGGAQRLPTREAAALGLLLAAGGEPVSRAALDRALEISPSVVSRAADAVIGRLRRRLGARHLIGDRGAGWRLIPLGGEAAPRPVQIGDRIRLGPLTVDLGARTVESGGREASLTRREAAVLDELLRHPGVCDRQTLARRVWGRPMARQRLDVVVCQLRQKLGHQLVTTVRGVGYSLRLPRSQGEDPDASIAPILARLASGGLVTLVGAPGAGKSALARQIAERSGALRLELHGAAPPSVLRALDRLPPEGLVVLDGLDDARPFAASIPSDRPVLLTARAPAGLPGEQVVRIPGTFERPDPELRSRIAPEAAVALGRLAWFVDRFDEQDAEGVLEPEDPRPEVLADRSLLERVPGGAYRLLIPIREAIRDQDPERHARWILERVGRDREARPFDPTPLRESYPDLLRAQDTLLARDPPASARAALLRAWIERMLNVEPVDRTSIACAAGMADDPEVRAELLLELGLSLCDGGDAPGALAAFREAQAVGVASARCRALLCEANELLQLGDPDAAWAALTRAEERLPDSYCVALATQRKSWMLLRQQQLERPRELLVEGLAAVARARFTPGDLLEADGWRSLQSESILSRVLGNVLRLQQQFAGAASVLQRSLALDTRLGAESSKAHTRMWLATLWGDMGRREAADGEYRAVIEIAERLGNESLVADATMNRAAVRIYFLQTEGIGPVLDALEANTAASGAGHVSRHIGFLRGMLAVAAGEQDGVLRHAQAIAARFPAEDRLVEQMAATARAIRGDLPVDEAEALLQLGRTSLMETLRSMLARASALHRTADRARKLHFAP